jgi:deoxyribodipyrimidine photolyase-related protein
VLQQCGWMADPERRWCFADQLGPHFLDGEGQPVLLIESRAVLRRRRFHRQKAHLVLSALRHRATELGDRALFVQAETYREALAKVREPLTVCGPTSHKADEFVRSLDGVTVLPSRGFATSRDHSRTGPPDVGRVPCVWRASTAAPGR